MAMRAFQLLLLATCFGPLSAMERAASEVGTLVPASSSTQGAATAVTQAEAALDQDLYEKFEESVRLCANRDLSWTKDLPNTSKAEVTFTLLDCCENQEGVVIATVGLKTLLLSLKGTRAFTVPAGESVTFALERPADHSLRTAIFEVTPEQGAPEYYYAGFIGIGTGTEPELRMGTLPSVLWNHPAKTKLRAQRSQNV